MIDKEYFKHDIFALADSELKNLVREYKAFGYAVYFVGVELLYQAKGEKVDVTDFCCSIKENLRENESELSHIMEVVKYAIDKGILATDGNLVYSLRVTEACKEREEIRTKLSEAGIKGMKTRWGDNTPNNPPNNPPYKQGYNKPYNPPITEKRREEKEKESTLTGTKERVPLSECVNSFVEAFNNTCISLPRVISLSEKRKNMVRACYTTFGDKIMGVPALVEASDFLTGRTGVWKASFDWLINTNNMRKVIEGNYANNGTPKVQKTTRSHMVTDNDLRAEGVNTDGSLALR